MNPAYEIHEQIDLYLKGHLNPDEKSGFEKLLQHDSELQDLMEAQRIANELIIDEELLELKGRMQREMNSPWFHSSFLIFSTIAVSAIGTMLFFLLSTPDTSTVNTNSGVVILKEKADPEKASINPAAKTQIRQSIPVASRDQVTTPAADPTPEVYAKELASLEIPSTVQNTIVSSSETKIEEEKLYINCDKQNFTAKTSVLYQDDYGIIVIDSRSIEGGTPPYSFSLDKEHFTSLNRFENLEEGNYQVYIQDKHRCVQVLSDNIQVKLPMKELNEVITPSMGEVWNYPMGEQLHAQLIIRNKAGQEVYASTIRNASPSYWDGRDNTGREIPGGNYYFILTFDDGTVQKGQISILR